MEALIFWVFGLLALVMGVLVVFHKNPISSALSLIVVLFCTSALYVLLQASFIAVIQVMVYAGAIMVLFVFVIMLLCLQSGGASRLPHWSGSKVLGALAVVYLLFVIAGRSRVLAGGKLAATIDGSVQKMGQLLLSDYLFGFEAISVLLLTAVVGAVVLGHKRLT